MATTSEIAREMLRLVLSEGELHQNRAVSVATSFGAGFVYRNRHGNTAISREVLREFTRLRHDLTRETNCVVLWYDRGPYNKKWILVETDGNGRILGKYAADE